MFVFCVVFVHGLVRTKQYMQDRDYNSCFLFYPGVVGEQKIPDGLPLGEPAS